MTCPNCQQPTTAAQEQCPRCAALLLTLPPGTRLHHRFIITRPVSRRGVVTYEATDEHDGGQTVTLLEYLPAGSRRMGALVILDANGQSGREFWAARMQRWQAVAAPTLQPITALFEQHGTTYAVLPHSSDQAAPPMALQGQQVEPLLRSLLPALQALHAEGAAGPFQVTAIPPRLSPDPQTNWPAELTPPEGQGSQLPTPATDLYALAGLILTAASGQPLPTPAQRTLGRPLPALPSSVPATIQGVLTACLALDESVRPQTAEQVLALMAARTPPETTAKTPRWTRAAHGSWITHLRLSGGLLSSTGPDQQVLVYDRSGAVVWRHGGLLGKPVGLVATPTTTVVADVTGTVHTWSRGQHAEQRGPVRIDHLASLSDDQVITINDDQSLALWNVDPLRRLGTAHIPLDWVTATGTTQAGLLLLGDGQGRLWEFDPLFSQVIPRGVAPVPAPMTCIATGDHLVLTASGAALVIWPAERAPETVWTAPHPIRAMALDPAGHLAYAAAGREVFQVNLAQGNASMLYRAAAPVSALALAAPDLAAGTEDGTLVMLTIAASASK